MIIDPIKNGIVIDHIKAGKGKEIYDFLELDELTCPVALIKNVPSKKTGKKDIIKIDEIIKCIWCIWRLKSGKWLKRINASNS